MMVVAIPGVAANVSFDVLVHQVDQNIYALAVLVHVSHRLGRDSKTL